MDVQAVADLAAAEAFAAEGDGLLAKGVERGGARAEAAGAVARATSDFGHVANVVRNVGFRYRWATRSVVRAITGGLPENPAEPWWGRCVRWTA